MKRIQKILQAPFIFLIDLYFDTNSKIEDLESDAYSVIEGWMIVQGVCAFTFVFFLSIPTGMLEYFITDLFGLIVLFRMATVVLSYLFIVLSVLFESHIFLVLQSFFERLSIAEILILTAIVQLFRSSKKSSVTV